MQVPVFLLRKLYVKGSLKNTDLGFEFKIKNSLSNGTAIGIDPIKVDGVEYPLDSLKISAEGTEVEASKIAPNNAFPIKVGVEITLHVKAPSLSPGQHKLDISLTTKEVGKLAFDVTDTI
ncbi:MAG: hydroxymethylglutaryl-CoA reductase [Candidatus Thorarchaeota archaeon]